VTGAFAYAATNLGTDTYEEGLSESFQNSAGEYTTDAPPEVIALRQTQPNFVTQEDQIWAASQPKGLLGSIFGIGAQERSLIVYQNIADGSLKFDTHYVGTWNPDTGAYDRIRLPNDIPVPSGYRLLVIEHTHPFPFCMGCMRGGYARGPSEFDQTTAAHYPNTFSIIRALMPANLGNEFEYYGPKGGGG
jgi:hypothetical protein